MKFKVKVMFQANILIMFVIISTYMEANACTDVLANMRCDHGSELRVYDQYPASLITLLQADAMGITIPKVIFV
jgi:putative component of toxin-antitoxin plasmid stabilization module